MTESLGAAASGRVRLNIGEVLDRLRPDFPGVTIPKIRFLEDKGLVKPERTPSGYRKFSTDDIERLRYVLRMQRDHYLPLRVIKDQLEADQARSGPLTRSELLDAAGIDERSLAELEEFGLVLRSGRQYPPEAVGAVRAVIALGRYGVQARHLRVLRASADRETALIEQVVAPILQQRSPGARDRAAESARDIASLVRTVHAALIEMTLADAGFAGREPGGNGR